MPKTDSHHDEFDELDKIAAGRAVISRAETARALNRTAETLDGWIARRLFPAWMQLTPGGPREQSVKVLRAYLLKRRHARYTPPAKRGRLMRGTQMEGSEND
jgi:hypothetical protein